MANGQWIMANGQWAMSNGQLAMGDRQWAMGIQIPGDELIAEGESRHQAAFLQPED